MLDRSIASFKRTVDDEGVLSALRLCYGVMNSCVLERLYTEVVFKRHASPNSFRVVSDVPDKGFKMAVFSNHYGISKELVLHRSHERDPTALLKKLLRKDMICLDVGSNIGYYALLEGRYTSKVYAIEPVPENFALLNRNIALNCLENVESFNYACSDHNGFLDIYLSDKCNLCSALKTDKDFGKVSCKSVTIDSFVDDAEIDYRDTSVLLRMDIEGYEYKVLEGALNLLSKSTNMVLFLELHFDLMRAQGWNPAEPVRLIKQSGFRFLNWDNSAIKKPVFHLFALKGEF
jgi:FkbM family methyltransferase